MDVPSLKLTASSPLKNDDWKTTLPLKMVPFQGRTASFRAGKWLITMVIDRKSPIPEVAGPLPNGRT